MPDRRRWTICRAIAILQLAAMGWYVPVQAAEPNPDWLETEAPAPPELSSNPLLRLEMPRYVSLQFGIDPASVRITPDGIVRYVVVATSASGLRSAFYEGIRCATGEVKTYARTSGDHPWSMAQDAKWRDLTDNLPSKHALAFARQGACEGHTTPNSAADIIRAMKR